MTAKVRFREPKPASLGADLTAGLNDWWVETAVALLVVKNAERTLVEHGVDADVHLI